MAVWKTQIMADARIYMIYIRRTVIISQNCDVTVEGQLRVRMVSLFRLFSMGGVYLRHIRRTLAICIQHAAPIL